MVPEYRALRACVPRLFGAKGTDPAGLSRFNEGIDEVLAETVSHYLQTTDRYRDQSLGILGHDLRNLLTAIITSAASRVRSAEQARSGLREADRLLNTADFVPARRLAVDGTTLALWHLDETTGTTFADSSPNAYGGALGAGAAWAIDTGYSTAVCQ